MQKARSVLRRRGVAGMLGLAAGAAIMTPGPASAATTDNIVPIPHAVHYSGCGYNGLPVCQTDNSKVYYYMDSHDEFKLESDDKSNVTSVLRDEYSPTDLAIYYDSTPVFSGSGETDIVYQEGSSGIDDDSAGMTWCNAYGGDTYDCDQQYVRIRGGGDYLWDGLVCHETGHAVGLVHGNDASPWLSQTHSALACMQTPVDRYVGLGTNNTQNINAVYPRP